MRRRVATGACVLAVLALLIVAFCGRPRSVLLAISAASASGTGSGGLAEGQDAALITGCGSSPFGVVTASESLLRRDRDSQGWSLAASAKDSVILAERGWFGAYRFWLVAPDGAQLKLEPTNRYLNCSVES